MAYKYKMVQVPPNIAVNAKAHKGTEAAAYLETIVNDMAGKGWEFFRIDSIGVNIQPGCFAALTGQKEVQATYYVITFRQPA